MDKSELVGKNTKWYRYQKGLTQEQFAEITNFKMAYINTIENGHANITCRIIDLIADALEIEIHRLFIEDTAIKANTLPKRVVCTNQIRTR